MDANALGIDGSTQPEVFEGTVDGMAQKLLVDAAALWQETFVKDGPVEIWVINGKRYLTNGNHRFHAAQRAGVEIPDEMIKERDMTGSQIVTFLLKDLTWLPGTK